MRMSKQFSKNFLKETLIVLLSLSFLGCAKSTFKAKNYTVQGDYYFSQNDFAKTVEKYQQALEAQPGNSSHLTMLGWAYFKLGNYDQAISAFELLARQDPKAFDAYTGQGWSHFKKGNYDQAIEYFNKAIEIDPDAADPYDGIGWASFNKGELDKAQQYFTTALHKGMKYQSGLTTKTDPEAHRGLGYVNFSKGDFKTALKHFKMASLLRPDWNDARTKWGDCLFSMGRYPDSLCIYRHCAKYLKNAEVYDKMGWSYFSIEENRKSPDPKHKGYKNARDMFNKALAIDPQYANSLAGLAKIEEKIGND